MQHFSPYAAFQGVASRQPEHEAIVFDDLRISYGELAERVAAFGSLLLREGFAPGEVAGICIRDEVSHLVAAMAVLCMNTPQISLGSHESGSTRRALAERVGVTQLIVEAAEDWMAGLRIIAMPPAGVDVGGGSLSNLRPDASQALELDRHLSEYLRFDRHSQDLRHLSRASRHLINAFC